MDSTPPLTLAQQLRKLAEARREEDERALANIRARAVLNANEGRFDTSWTGTISAWLRDQLLKLGFDTKEEESMPNVTNIMW